MQHPASLCENRALEKMWQDVLNLQAKVQPGVCVCVSLSVSTYSGSHVTQFAAEQGEDVILQHELHLILVYLFLCQVWNKKGQLPVLLSENENTQLLIWNREVNKLDERGIPSARFQPKSLSCAGRHPFSWGQRPDQWESGNRSPYSFAAPTERKNTSTVIHMQCVWGKKMHRLMGNPFYFSFWEDKSANKWLQLTSFLLLQAVKRRVWAAVVGEMKSSNTSKGRQHKWVMVSHHTSTRFL